ncbi:Hypothetical predicted protein, partial [Pelobates cultripes]
PQIAQHIRDDIKMYFDINCSGDVTADTIWQAHKAVVRGSLIKHGSYAKKLRKATYDTLLQKIMAITHANKQNPTQTQYDKLRTLQTQLNEVELNKTNHILHRYRHKFFAQ